MILIIIGLIALCLNFLLLLYRYGFAIYHVQEIVLTTNPIYIILSTALPVLWWLYSTKEDEFNFYDRKKRTLFLVVCNATLTIGQIVWTFTFDTLVMEICKIPIGRNLDEHMIFILCRFVLIGMIIILIAIVYGVARKLLDNDEVVENIENVRWQYVFDTRKNKEVAYDLNILRVQKTGKKLPIKENDRFVHIFILGNTGTGKTSSTFTPAIVCDLDTKLENGLKREAAIMKFCREDKAVVIVKHQGKANEYDVEAKKGFEKELEDIRNRYPDCGITVLAPNSALNKDLIKLTAARGQQINILDPAFNFKNPNVRMVGLNPFYVNLDQTWEEKQNQIKNNAQSFAQVLLAVSEIHGLGDTYFRDINESVTTNVSICCMLHASLNQKQTTIAQIQKCIADFGKLKPLIEEIEEILHFKVVVHQMASKKDLKKDAKNADRDSIKAPSFDENTTDDIIFYPLKSLDDLPPSYRDKGMTLEECQEIIRKEAEGYAESIHFIKQELLGSGAEDMFSQARGLRNILSKLLLNGRIKRILSSPEENLLDFDKVFMKGEITVINTALEFGAESSTALGLFILLTMKNAVVRRPDKNRMNHFVYIDEAAQYMHPVYEDMFALFRQYRVSTNIAMQTLAQFKKNPNTSYLQDVIMGSGVHIVFGRISAEEMRIYEEISGIEHIETNQTSLNANSEFDPDYKVTKGQRRTVQEKSVQQGYKIRQRGFQEVTVNAIDQGRVLKSIHCKTTFTKKSDYKDKKITEFNFEKFAQRDETKGNIIEISKGNENAREEMERYRTTQSIDNTRDESDAISTLPVDKLNDSRTISSESISEKRRNEARALLEKVSNRKSYTSERHEEADDFEKLDPMLLAKNNVKKEKPDKKEQKVENKNTQKKAKQKEKDNNIPLDDDTNFNVLFDGEDDENIQIDENALLDELYEQLTNEKRDY